MADVLISQSNKGGLRVGDTLSSLLFFIGLVLMVGSIAMAGGAFAYKQLLTSRTTALKQQEQQLEEDLRPELLNQILALDRKVQSLRTLLLQHPISSNIFQFLEENTLTSVRFTSFSFAADSRKIDLAGEAASYTTLAEQVRTFEAANEKVERVDFGGLSANEKGVVSFKMSIIIKPALLRLSQ